MPLHRSSIKHSFSVVINAVEERISEYARDEVSTDAVMRAYEAITTRRLPAAFEKNAPNASLLRGVLVTIVTGLKLLPNLTNMFFDEFFPSYAYNEDGIDVEWTDNASATKQNGGMCLLW